MEETSLSDFVAESEDGEGETDVDRGEAGDADVDRAEADDPATATESTDEPPGPAITAAYSPGGETCQACGLSVDWRWVEGERHVCGACKDW